MDDLIRRKDAIDAVRGRFSMPVDNLIVEVIGNLPSAQPEPKLYGYPIEHLEMIARVMAKENCTPEDVVRMLQNAGEIVKMVRDEFTEMLKESIERTCKGVANENCN